MKLEHYGYICQHFNLEFDVAFAEDVEEGRINIEQLAVRRIDHISYVVDNLNYGGYLAWNVSRELAAEILQYTKDTEILFL